MQKAQPLVTFHAVHLDHVLDLRQSGRAALSIRRKPQRSPLMLKGQKRRYPFDAFYMLAASAESSGSTGFMASSRPARSVSGTTSAALARATEP